MEKHPELNLPAAPLWALNVGFVGKSLIILGVILFVVSAVLLLLNRNNSARIGAWALGAGCASIFGAAVCLGLLFAKDQFEFQYVFSHSETRNALQYKIASIWSGQEGSFLLWALTSSFFAMLTLRGTGPHLRFFGATVAVFLACLCGILCYESPFTYLPFPDAILAIPEGNGLAPSLNNYWVVIHPPTIFMGFGSLLVPFAYAVSALARRDYDDWATRVRPWAILSISLLGLGLCMGGFWAYETLGWGGFWKWDPVENVSFVPWVMVTVLAHGILVQVTKKKWHFTNLLMAAAPFLLFCYGTFLTRAGFLDKVSVHSFAKMEESAHRVLLWFLVGSVAGFMALWITRVIQDRRKFSQSTDTGLRRDGFYATGNVFMATLAIATAIGMSVPLIQFVMGQTPKVVDEGLYHQVLVWFFLPILFLMAIAPYVPWRRSGWGEVFARTINIFSVSLLATGITLIIGSRPGIGIPRVEDEMIHIMKWDVPAGRWILFLVWLCAFAALGNLWRLVQTLKRSPMGIGPFVAHIGVAVTMAGLIVSRGLERKTEYALQPGRPATPLSAGSPSPTIELVMDENFDSRKFFDRDNKVRLNLKGDGLDFQADPGLYYMVSPDQAEPTPVTWPSIQHFPSHDIYVVLSPLQQYAPTDLTLKPGQKGEIGGMDWTTRDEHRYRLTYVEMKREGEAGKEGTKFGARLKVEKLQQVGPNEWIPSDIFEATPKMVLGGKGGPEKVSGALDNAFDVEMLGMNAADKSVTLGLKYKIPVFPVEVFYKPMTMLVWTGVGTLFFGGLIAAWDRRRRRSSKPETLGEPIMEEKPELNDDALVSVP